MCGSRLLGVEVSVCVLSRELMLVGKGRQFRFQFSLQL